MFEGWAIVPLAMAYVGILFLIAWFGDRARLKGDETRPLIYSLSLAVYCTSWTFFGSVGLAAETGYDFIPVYLGPILLFMLRPAAGDCASCGSPRARTSRRSPTSSPRATARARPSRRSSRWSRWSARCPTSRCN